jgi:phosphohistidine phosphatase
MIWIIAPASTGWQSGPMDASPVPGSRRLLLLRHAKSAWPEGVSDHKRPLTHRGRRDATAAGRWLRAHVDRLDAVACSTAERARETWALVAAELADPPEAAFDDGIYGAPPDALVAVVGDLPDDAATALLVGHNPGVQQLVGLLSGEEAEMRTASVAELTWTGRWSDVTEHIASLKQHTTPRGSGA